MYKIVFDTLYIFPDIRPVPDLSATLYKFFIYLKVVFCWKTIGDLFQFIALRDFIQL